MEYKQIQRKHGLMIIQNSWWISIISFVCALVTYPMLNITVSYILFCLFLGIWFLIWSSLGYCGNSFISLVGYGFCMVTLCYLVISISNKASEENGNLWIYSLFSIAVVVGTTTLFFTIFKKPFIRYVSKNGVE